MICHPEAQPKDLLAARARDNIPMDKIAALTDILAQDPNDSFARYGLAMAYAAEGRNDEALREYATATEKAPDYVPAYQMSAQLLLKLGRTSDAQSRLEAGLEAAARTGNAHAASEMQAMLDDLS
jgi:tetratricopeptide (TPR) repeat protein